jgi:hypothetical protein
MEFIIDLDVKTENLASADVKIENIDRSDEPFFVSNTFIERENTTNPEDLPKSSPDEVVVKINGDQGENFEITPLLQSVPWSPKMIVITKSERREIVEDCLHLKKIKNERSNVTAIQNFYKKYHPEEFEAHERLNNWSHSKITADDVPRWVRRYIEKEKKLKEITIEQIKSEEEIHKDKIYQEELELFLKRPQIKVCQDITENQKEEIIIKSISLEGGYLDWKDFLKCS